MKRGETVYRARKIWREDGTLLDDGAVACRAGKITDVGRWAEIGAEKKDAEIVDLGGVLLLPGLINTHTHLRLTHLKGRIPPSTRFVRWLGQIALRSKLTRRKTFERSIAAGARELLAGGVTTAVELDVDGLSTETLAASPLRLIFAHECISLNPERAEETARRLFQKVGRLPREALRKEHGIAPHAPYSVSRELWEALSRGLNTKNVGWAVSPPASQSNPPLGGAQVGSGGLTAHPTLLAIHISESADEVEMFAEGRGRMVKWLRMFRVLPRGWQPPRCSPVEFLERTGILGTPGIAAHCGCVSEADAKILARHGWTVAFCPGTHEYFKRPPYPLELLRRAGVPVCVATDSAASNTGLSMMEELRRAARMFPDPPPAELLAMATTIPARAIGWERAVGRIEPGYCADFAAWSPAPAGERLDRAWLMNSELKCAATIIDGQRVASPVP